MAQDVDHPHNGLEYFLLRTLPSKTPKIRCYSGNRDTPSNQKKVSGLKMSLEEKEVAALREVFAGTDEYVPSRRSTLRALFFKKQGTLGVGSLTGTQKNKKHLAEWVSGKSAGTLT